MERNKGSILLDVDPSIIEKNITITKENSMEDEIKKYFGPPEIPNTSFVKPLPGFCVKTWIKNEDTKVFINICQTPQIPAPDDISDDELVKILSSDEPSLYRVPMSMGDAHSEGDRHGQPADVYDVAINTNFFEKVQKKPIFHSFFLTVVFEGLQDKYQFELEANKYIILKNKKSMGILMTHRIQKRDVEKVLDKTYTPLIEEIKAVQNKAIEDLDKSEPASNANVVEDKPKVFEIKYKLRREPIVGKVEYLIGEFNIDAMTSATDIHVDVGEDRIIIEVPKNNQILDVFIPYRIIQKNVRAILNQNTGILTVKMAASDAA